MSAHHQTDIALEKRFRKNGSDIPLADRQAFPKPLSPNRPETPAPPTDASRQKADDIARQKQALLSGRVSPSSASSFTLEEISAIVFRCGICETVVRFPRLRWASFPETCPNCGAQWMRQPSSDNPLSEDKPTYTFRVILAFREALQAIAGMTKNSLFSLTLETNQRPNPGKAKASESRRNGMSHV